MAIYVTGDTHGGPPSGVDGFMRRLNTQSFPEQRQMDKSDYVVILGDFGGVWEADRFSSGESRAEKNALDWLEDKPFTTLFVPGNHENYDRLTGISDQRLLDSWYYADMPAGEKEKLKGGYPRKAWRGGFVREIRPSVMMLERGFIFDIDGRSCLAFGGARSHDISGGVLNPADYADAASFRQTVRAARGSLYRISGVTWWAREMPGEDEMADCLSRVRAYNASSGKIDFVFTHDAPASDKRALGLSGTDGLSDFLEALRLEMDYGLWFYGHLHDNARVGDRHYLLYEQIIRIN